MLKFIFSEQFLSSMILFSVPIIFASLSALISNKTGMLNINVEGSMSLAALGGGLVSYTTKSWLLGLLAAILIGILMSYLFSLFTLKIKTDSILTGIALNMLATGLTIYLLYIIIGVKGDSSLRPSVLIPAIKIPLLEKIPVVGNALFSQNILVYIAFLSVIILNIILKRTKFGLHARAVGFNETAAKSVGINTNLVKIISLLVCGLFAGLGGAYLSMVYLSYFSAGMVAGRGFIGIAAEAMGQGQPYLTMLFALLFGAVDYFAIGAQTVLGFPYELLNTLPYLMTIMALMVFAIINNNKKNKTTIKLKNPRKELDKDEKV